MKKIISICVMASILSCNTEPAQKITGTYVREKKLQQKHYTTGKIIGTYNILDTLMISKKEVGYQIENHVWRKNDYDKDGWQQKYDGTIKTHAVKFDKTDNSLNTEMNFYKPMYLDFETRLLFYSKRTQPWKKIN